MYIKSRIKDLSCFCVTLLKARGQCCFKKRSFKVKNEQQTNKHEWDLLCFHFHVAIPVENVKGQRFGNSFVECWGKQRTQGCEP